MPKILNLIGEKFDRLLVTERIGSLPNAKGEYAVWWRCQCDCGEMKETTSSNLRTGNVRSCGCIVFENAKALTKKYPHASVVSDLTGAVSGYVKALRPSGKRSARGLIMWVCECVCGKQFEAPSAKIKIQEIVSCGCLRGLGTVTHGATINKKWTSEYLVWAGVRARCLYPESHAYPRYGGRGITICPTWEDFEVFLADMGRRPPGKTLDRKDNNAGYSKDNCRWATPKEQARNKRNNRLLEFQGEAKCLAEWAEMYHVRPGKVWARLNRGWPIERALLTP